MALFNHNINNLSGGVSQQPQEARFDNQVESMVNFVPTVAQGLRRRNPIIAVDTLTETTFTDNMAIHSYDRGDGIEKYGMIMSDNGLKIFGTDGTNYEVVDFGSASEKVTTRWAGTDWKNDIQFLTVGDTTWMLNKSVVVSTTGELTPTDKDDYVAFYWAKKSFDTGSSGYTYNITLDDIPFTASSTSTSGAASTLAGAINTHYVSGGVGTTVITWSGYVDGTLNIELSCATASGGSYSGAGASSTLEAGVASAGGFYDETNEVNHGDINAYLWYHPDTTTAAAADNYVYILTNTSGRGSLTMTQSPNSSNGYKLKVAISDPDYSEGSYSFHVTRYLNLNSLYATVVGSIVRITKPTFFKFSSGDSWGNQASVGWQKSVAKISDLPATMAGFTNEEVGTIAITGTDKDTFTNYYLKWDTDHWAEAVKEGIEYKIDHLTMPAKIVRQDNGTYIGDVYQNDHTFTLGWNVEYNLADGFNNVWDEREKGDDDSNPIPSFVGNKISNMFFFKNRLGFTSEESVILSKTANYYDFFASTVMEILDTDPIDAAADSNNISIIRAINVTGGAITLWTDTAQFILSGGEILSPATTRISQTSSYIATPSLIPINIDNSVMFFNTKGDWLEALNYTPSTVNNDNSTAQSLSAHVPEYLPATIDSVVSAPNENLVLFFDSVNNPNNIYVYKYHIHNGERKMSAWFKWTFDITMKKIEVLSNTLFILSGTNSLHSMDLSVGELSDTYKDEGTTSYESSVTLSRFHAQTKQGTQVIREPFYAKTVLAKADGLVDLDIVNDERNNVKTINSKHVNLSRKILVGGHTDKVKLRFRTSYDTGVSINAINIEGQMKVRSRNI